ncbi:MAG: hypothetical protein ACO1QB_04880 [Verrucomicrobiales bacterium]
MSEREDRQPGVRPERNNQEAYCDQSPSRHKQGKVGFSAFFCQQDSVPGSKLKLNFLPSITYAHHAEDSEGAACAIASRSEQNPFAYTGSRNAPTKARGRRSAAPAIKATAAAGKI